MSLQNTLSPGTVIGGHYIIGSLLNSGGFGAVYRGVDASEGHRSCAIKETYDVTPAARRQALMEVSVLLTVRSQHLPDRRVGRTNGPGEREAGGPGGDITHPFPGAQSLGCRAPGPDAARRPPGSQWGGGKHLSR